MFQLVELGFYSILDARVIVAEQVDPPGTDAIQVAFAVHVVQPDAFAALDGHQRQGLVAFHLRAGVPYGMQAALQQEGVVIYHGYL